VKILIIRIAALGDVARATSMLSAVRSENPDAEISWLVGRSFRPLLAIVPGIDRVLEVDERRIFAGTFIERSVEILRLWTRLAGRKFDRVILAHPDLRYRLLVLGVRSRDTRILAPPSKDSEGAIADEFAALAAGRAVAPAEFAVSDVRARVEGIRLSKRHSSKDARPIVALAPGGARNVARDDPLRRWPLTSYASLASALLDDGYRVVLIGSDGDSWVREAFRDLEVDDFVGELTVPELLRFMRDCHCIVSHDTGPLHLAQLVRAPVVGLFGPTDPGRVVGELPNVRTLWGGAHLQCRPCYDGRKFAVCHRNICMEDIAVDQVLQVVDDLRSGVRPTGV
jgi:heptosyltransferase-2